MFWNLENFFDYRDDGNGASDKEFSSLGERHWTKKRFYAKCNAVAKAVLWVGSKHGRLPDLIGLAEIENDFVLERLVHATALRKYGYGVVHYDSPDERGIDVALLYRKSVFDVVSSSRHPVPDPDNAGRPMKTRDILSVSLKDLRLGGESPIRIEGRSGTLTVLVNHHPSKYGGGSALRRDAAIRALRAVSDSLAHSEGNPIVAMGDFNETPENELFLRLGPDLSNKALPLAEKGKGSIKYDGRWELIDMFFVSKSLDGRSSMEVIEIPFLTERDKVHSGVKPLRSYSGPRHIGGVSDHFPVLLSLW